MKNRYAWVEYLKTFVFAGVLGWGFAYAVDEVSGLKKPNRLHSETSQLQQESKDKAALDKLQQTPVIDREERDRLRDLKSKALSLNFSGLAYKKQGQYSQAMEDFERALAIQREVGDRSGEGTTLTELGIVYDDLGEYSQAIEYYHQALAIQREVGDRSGEGTTLNNLGTSYKDLGEYSQAMEYLHQALVIIREVGARAREGRTLNNLNAVRREFGNSANEPSLSTAY